jgi:hypothetical protein
MVIRNTATSILIIVLLGTTAIAQTVDDRVPPNPSPSPNATRGDAPPPPPSATPPDATPAPNIEPPSSTSPSSLTPAEAARVHFQQGVVLFNEADYVTALAEFTASYAALPQAFVLYNIALTQKALFRYGEAVETLQQYLTAETNIAPEQRTEAEQILREMRALLADVSIVGPPDGAVVQIDGREVARTPLSKALSIASGTHTIDVAAAEYEPHHRQFMVVAGVPLELKVTLRAIPKTGHVRVLPSVRGARVSIDGLEVRDRDLAVELAPGGHTIEVTAPGYETHHGEVVVAAGQKRSVSIGLRRVQRRAWYGKWYVWAPIGALVVGGVGVGIALTSTEDPLAGSLSPGAGRVE